jgi:hypothetical protein
MGDDVVSCRVVFGYGRKSPPKAGLVHPTPTLRGCLETVSHSRHSTNEHQVSMAHRNSVPEINTSTQQPKRQQRPVVRRVANLPPPQNKSEFIVWHYVVPGNLAQSHRLALTGRRAMSKLSRSCTKSP